MNRFNAADELRRWHEARQKSWQARGIAIQLKLPNRPDLNKATMTFEARTHVASITVWGTGMVEFIVLDSATNQEAIVSDKECDSAESLWLLLDDHVRDLIALVRQSNGGVL
jgi:hypothetical protein